MITLKKLIARELILLTEKHRYNDVHRMIDENTRMLGNREGDIFCLLENGEIVAELWAKYEYDNKMYAVKGVRAYFHSFVVYSEFRGKGYGKKLLSFALDYLSKNGYSQFTVGIRDDNKRALHIFLSFGFETLIGSIKAFGPKKKYHYNIYLKQ